MGFLSKLIFYFIGDAVASEMVDVGMTVEINPDNGILCDQTGSPINLTTLINIPTGMFIVLLNFSVTYAHSKKSKTF